MNPIPHIFQQIDASAGGPLLDVFAHNIPSASFLTVVASVAAPCSGVLICSTIGSPIGLYDGSTLRAIIPAGFNDYLGVRFNTTAVIQLKSLTGSPITAAGAGTDLLAIQLVQ